MNKITLYIGGKDRVFHFGLGFIGNLLESEKLDFTQVDTMLKENPFKWIPLIMYYSTAYQFTINNETPDFTKFDVSDWIDEVGMNSSIVLEFFTAFNLSLTKNVPEDKKKVVAKKK